MKVNKDEAEVVIKETIDYANNEINKTKKKKEEEAPAAPTTKICPFCKSEIPIDATRCPHCTSEQPEEKAE